MSFEYIQRIPLVDEIKAEIPLSNALVQAKKQYDIDLKKIFMGEDSRFLLIIGPCSADNEDAVIDYMNRLRGVYERVKEKIFIIPRVYTNKPRTTGEGYKGMAHQPDPNDKPNIVEGLKAIRRMHIRVLAESGFASADEMLYPANYPYLEDLLGYVAVGARSVENQQHRLTVSGFDIPVGMKNPTSGDLTVMLNSVQAAQLPHDFIYAGSEVKTTGNPLAHAILRGAFNSYGVNIPNYHYEEVNYLMGEYIKRGLEYPTIIVDCNHANSGKKFKEQPRIAKEILNSRRYSEQFHNMVKGLLIESYIVGGTQKVEEGTYGKSITDPCLSWDDSEKLIYELAELL